MSGRTVEAIITAVVGLVIVLGVRWGNGLRSTGQAPARLPRPGGGGAAPHDAPLSPTRRVALVAVIAAGNVLSLYPETDQIVNALLASSAVVAIFVGLAFNTPLSNLGSGMLVAFAQPLRLGDRVTVGEHTGFVEEMDLLYTTLVTDEARSRVHPEQPAHLDDDRQPDDPRPPGGSSPPSSRSASAPRWRARGKRFSAPSTGSQVYATARRASWSAT